MERCRNRVRSGVCYTHSGARADLLRRRFARVAIIRRKPRRDLHGSCDRASLRSEKSSKGMLPSLETGRATRDRYTEYTRLGTQTFSKKLARIGDATTPPAFQSAKPAPLNRR